MGTRSFVGMMRGDKIRAVYVHFDGYLSGVGAELQDYTSRGEVEKLISEGDRSSLTEGFYKFNGEDDVDPVDYESFDEFYESCKDSWGEYYYVWKDNVWHCGDTYDKYDPTPITRKLVPYSEAVKLLKTEI